MKYITSRIKHYVETELLDKLIKTDAYIAGGALTCIFQNQQPNDIDIFCSSESNADMSSLFNWLSSNKAIQLSSTENAITFQYLRNTIQLIKPKCLSGDPLSVINQFDFTICMAAYKPKTEEIILGERFIQDLLDKRLVYNPNSIRPLSTLNRLPKYLGRGYSIGGIDLLKLGLAVNNIKITTNKELKNEILGIDTMFLEKYLKTLDNEEPFDYEKQQLFLKEGLTEDTISIILS